MARGYLDGRQGPGAARRRPRDARQHHVQRDARHRGRKAQIWRASREDRRLPDAVGDAIDNIPGVDKVGPKTAARWIKQYGLLDGVIAHAGEITGSVGENLRKVLDWLPRGRELITVKRDVALPVTLD